jgi:hypothetical protein
MEWITLALERDRWRDGPSGAIKSGKFLDWLRTCPQFIAPNKCTVLMTILQY